MEYQLTAEVTPPTDAPELDALQRHGVAALLDEHLELLAEIEGPDGVEVEPLDHRIMVRPGGALITWVLDAPALSFAEEAARQVLGELLEHTELLTDWSVGRCEVTASDEDLAAALGDPEAAEEAEEIELAELESITGMGGLSEADRAARRAQLLEAAERLRAFGLEAFGYSPAGPAADDEDAVDVSEEAASLVAGAIMVGVDVLLDELFADVQSLEEAGTPAAEHEVLWALHDLPARFAEHYTALFAKKFLLTAAVLSYRLTTDEWDGPLTVAEALALHLVKVAAEAQLDLAELADELPLAEMFDSFDEYAFDDIDVAALYGGDEPAAEEEDGPAESVDASGDSGNSASADASADSVSADAEDVEAEVSDDEAEATVLDWFEPLIAEDEECDPAQDAPSLA